MDGLFSVDKRDVSFVDFQKSFHFVDVFGDFKKNRCFQVGSDAFALRNAYGGDNAIAR